MSIATDCRGAFGGKKCKRVLCLYLLHFVHLSRAEKLSRKVLYPYVSNRNYLEVFHTSLVDLDVLQMVYDATSTVCVAVLIPEGLLCLLLLQWWVCSLHFRCNRGRAQIHCNLLGVWWCCVDWGFYSIAVKCNIFVRVLIYLEDLHIGNCASSLFQAIEDYL